MRAARTSACWSAPTRWSRAARCTGSWRKGTKAIPFILDITHGRFSAHWAAGNRRVRFPCIPVEGVGRIGCDHPTAIVEPRGSARDLDECENGSLRMSDACWFISTAAAPRCAGPAHANWSKAQRCAARPDARYYRSAAAPRPRSCRIAEAGIRGDGLRPASPTRSIPRSSLSRTTCTLYAHP